MKKCTAFLLCFVTASLSNVLLAQTAKPFAMADFKKATWLVTNNGDEYNFTISNPKGGMTTNFEFDWGMTNGNDGHINITKEAMESAAAQNNYFGPKLKNATLTNQTTVWVSRQVFTNLSKKGTATMDVGNGPEVFTVVKNKDDDAETESFKDAIKVKGTEKTLLTLHVKNEDGSHQLWILNNLQNPVIIKMDLGWTIVLKTVE
ncbi:MAG: hypothetical protein JST86_09810 [Bacteroidetes bacterium]|nr:hypothetical protein [Bacteroidota bacterium]